MSRQSCHGFIDRSPLAPVSLLRHWYDPQMRVPRACLGDDPVDAIFALEASAAQRANRYDPRPARKRELEPAGRWDCPAWSEFGVTGEAMWTFTWLCLAHHDGPVHKGFAQRCHREIDRRRGQQVIERHKPAIEHVLRVAFELLVVFLTCPRRLLPIRARHQLSLPWAHYLRPASIRS